MFCLMAGASRNSYGYGDQYYCQKENRAGLGLPEGRGVSSEGISYYAARQRGAREVNAETIEV